MKKRQARQKRREDGSQSASRSFRPSRSFKRSFLNVYFYVSQLRLKRLGLSIENKRTRYSSAICAIDRPNRWSKGCLANEVLGSTRSSDFS